MVYRFLMLSDENDFFKREIRINSDSTFRDLNDFIVQDAGYDSKELYTFHICDDKWNKLQEITLIDMDLGSEYDSYIMDKTKLIDLIEDKGQKLIFVFDMLAERVFFLELVGIIPNERLDNPIMTIREGKAPKQSSDIDLSYNNSNKSNTSYDIDESLYGDEDYSMDEIDMDSLSDIDDYDSFDDRY